MGKTQIGDIFEIQTPAGKAYLHYIKKDPKAGRELVRILPGLYSERPSDFQQLASLEEQYLLFFPVSAAKRKRIIEWVGFYPADNIDMPKFMRDEFNVKGESLGWHIVDTQTWHRELVKDLTPEQRKLSDWASWNDTLLIKRLLEGWSLEKWV
jgi:hypothetical protein